MMSLHLTHMPFKDKLDFCTTWHTKVFDHWGRELGINTD